MVVTSEALDRVDLIKPVSNVCLVKVKVTSLSKLEIRPFSKAGRKKERKSIYIAPFIYSQSAQAWITHFYLQKHHACLSF